MENILEKYNFDEKVFEKLRNDFKSGRFTEEGNVIKSEVCAPDASMFVNINGIPGDEKEKYFKAGEKAIKDSTLGCVILNGGMATRFGGAVKGIVEAYDGKSFLRIKLEQVNGTAKKYGVKIPVFLMNSFATSSLTIEHLEKNKYFGLDPSGIHVFDQFIFRRLNPDGTDFMPDSANARENDRYYGPGHGDFSFAFIKSGLLYRFLNSGGEYLWFSNVDNLGATIDEAILGCHINRGVDMTVELAEKYTGDKGGAPALVDGKIQIVEQFKFPASFNQDSIKVFNSATYIFMAAALRKITALPFYIVKKDVCGSKAIQFERLAGDLSMYLDTNYVVVDREERFIPVKTQDDLNARRDYFRGRFK